MNFFTFLRELLNLFFSLLLGYVEWVFFKCVYLIESTVSATLLFILHLLVAVIPASWGQSIMQFIGWILPTLRYMENIVPVAECAVVMVAYFGVVAAIDGVKLIWRKVP